MFGVYKFPPPPPFVFNGRVTDDHAGIGFRSSVRAIITHLKSTSDALHYLLLLPRLTRMPTCNDIIHYWVPLPAQYQLSSVIVSCTVLIDEGHEGKEVAPCLCVMFADYFRKCIP